MILTREKLDEVLDRLPGLTLAVVGDLFLDKYLDLDAGLTEKSVETDLDAYQVVRVRCSPGAGGTVLNNLAALGVGRLLAVSVIGQDGEGFELKRALAQRRVETSLVVEAPERFTPTYTKPMLEEGRGPARELNRIDIKNRSPMPAPLEQQVLANVERALAEADGLIVADQVDESDCGVVTTAVRSRLAELAAANTDKHVLADSRVRIGLFRYCILKPNAAELAHALGRDRIEPANAETVAPAAHELARRCGASVFCTMGPNGILYAGPDGHEHIPGHPADGPIDIVGAGDSCMAGIACGLCAGCSPAEAAALGNLIASITVRQLGTTGTASPDQLREARARLAS